ncbi:sensor histidine kinase [Acidovorax sp. M2(2025)]|uniref:sensor histidine kinase n=1 Tax=Acidovorax sp. M2(2025) TaxID=3411355 RepID=UPI003BF55367
MAAPSSSSSPAASAPPPPSIRARLVQSLLWISVVFGVLTAVVVWQVISHELGELMDQELLEAAEIVQSAMASAENPAPRPAGTSGPDAPDEEHLVWQVVDSAEATVVSRSPKAPAQALLAAPAPAAQWTADGQWRAYTSAFRHQPGHFLVVAQSRAERDGIHQEVVLYTLAAALSVSLFSALLMNWRIRQELRPLGWLGRTVQAYDPLVPGTAPRGTPRQELQPIEQAIADLGQRLAHRVVRERAFTAHAAHALRTPVAGIDVQLALAIREAPEALQPRLVRTRQAAARLANAMNALLMMFRTSAEPQRQNLDLRHLLDDLAFHGLAVTLHQEATLWADPDLLAATLWNLLDNSRRFQARQVAVSVRQDATDSVLRVQDDGQGCAPDTCARLQESLQRQTYGEGSALQGLGLALADLVARAHGGHASVPRTPQGFCVELRWPAGPPSGGSHV